MSEKLDNFLNTIDNIPPETAKQLQLNPNSSNLREAHAELIQKALASETTYIFLTGNPGIGKTTAIAKFLQTQTCLDEGFLFFYVSPRIQVNLDIIEKFTNRETNTLCDDRILTLNTNANLIKNNGGKYTVNYLSNQRQGNFQEQGVHFIHRDSDIEPQRFSPSSVKRLTEDRICDVGQRSRGVLDSICSAIYTIINRNISQNIVATVAVQSLKKLQTGKDTFCHISRKYSKTHITPEKGKLWWIK